MNLVEELTQGIYIYRWIDQVNMQEVRASFEALKQTNLGKPYVTIVDMQKLKQIPYEIASLRAIIKEEMAEGLRGYVIYSAPRVLESFFKPMLLLAPTTYKFSRDWEVAVQLAQDLLQTK